MLLSLLYTKFKKIQELKRKCKYKFMISNSIRLNLKKGGSYIVVVIQIVQKVVQGEKNDKILF